jgi:hypothetical protein
MFDNIDKKLEKKVFIFTVLLVLAMFVTIALYVYAGKQQNLPTRELGAVNIKKTLGVNGKIYQQTDMIPVLEDGTMGSFDGGSKIYSISPFGNTTVYLPRVSSLDSLSNFSSGKTVTFYMVNESTNTVTLDINPDDQNRMSFYYTPTARTKGLTTIIIRKTNDNKYQVIV